MIVIQGYSSDDKVPGFVGETVFGAGAITSGSIPMFLLIVGTMGALGSGDFTPDDPPVDIFSQSDSEEQFEAGSEIDRMIAQALREPGVRIKAAAVGLGTDAVAATATITITGTATSTGEFRYRLGGELYNGGIISGLTPTQIGARIIAAFNGKPRCPVIATNSSGTVTLTAKSKGPRGNDYILFDEAPVPATSVTSAISGGSTVSGTGKKFTGGSVADNVTAVLANAFNDRYERIACPSYDATNLARWETHIDTKAGPLEGRMEHVIIGFNGSSSAAISIAQTTLNNARFSVYQLLNSESHPTEIAARVAALAVAKEQDLVNQKYDGEVLDGIAPQSYAADWPSRSTQQSCLDNGVSPLATQRDGTVTIVRAITTKCLSGTDPDYRTLDVSKARTPDYVRDDTRLFWTTVFLPANPYVRDDEAANEKPLPKGVATPKRWNAALEARLRRLEGQYILTDVANNLPVSEWNDEAGRIMSTIPVEPLGHQHAIGVSVRQVA